jgi:uncharacterized SAM-binding protein YcdF (DUF218 family)
MDEGLSDKPLFDKKEIARTTRFLSIESDEPEQADLAFDFGGQSLDAAYIAADLFKRGVVRYVLVSGGHNSVTLADEVDAHLAILISEGVPADRIIVENEATSTYAQALMALPKLRERLDLDSIRSVVAITKWYHCRRAVMTLKRNWPEGIRYYAHCYEPEGVSRLDWHLHQFLTQRVLSELDRIPEYLEKDQIAEIQIEDGAWV